MHQSPLNLPDIDSKTFYAIVAYLREKGPALIESPEMESKSVSSTVAKLLDAWKDLPNEDRKRYEDKQES